MSENINENNVKLNILCCVKLNVHKISFPSLRSFF